MPLVVQSNLHTPVVLSFFFYNRLRQKELEKKLNRPAKLSNEFESYLCKETSWFLTMEDQKPVYSAFKIYDLIKATHLRRPEEGSVIKYFEGNDSAG